MAATKKAATKAAATTTAAKKTATKSAAKKTAKKTAKRTGGGAFSADERAAMKERAAEVKRAAKGADGEKDVLDKIATMNDDDRAIAAKLHEIVKDVAPDLVSRTWYGMPAYAKDGDVLCFFQAAGKFKTRYATFGFSDKAQLDSGALFPTYFAIKELNTTAEREVRALLKKAVG